MEDQEQKVKRDNFVEMFMRPAESVIESFILGKNSKSLRKAGADYIKGLWQSANIEKKDEIFDLLISKIPYLHSYGAKASEFFQLITYILKENDRNKAEKGTNASQKINDVFQFLKQSLDKANELIFSHQNLELYSSIYSFINVKKQGLGGYTDYDQARVTSSIGKSSFGGNNFGGLPSSNFTASLQANKIPQTSGSSSDMIFIFEREPCMK
jgi:hypothetical protein